MGRPARFRKTGYAADVTSLGILEVAIKLDPRMTPRDRAELVKLADALAAKLASVNRTLKLDGVTDPKT